MNSNHNPALNKIRRSDRAKAEPWIEAFLLRGEDGTLGTVSNAQAFLVTRNYAYDPQRHCIYLHGAMKGQTFENIQANPRVCFSVSEMGRLLPAATAVEFSVEFSGVVIFGQASLVTDPEEATYGLQLLMDKYFSHLKPGIDYGPIDPAALKVTAVFKIEIESWSGKAKQVAPDFPGAFFYRDLPFNE